MKSKLDWSKEGTRAYMADRYYAQRKLFITTLGGKCAHCGSTERLEIDHKNPEDKSFGVGILWGEKRLPAALEELKKCQLLCHACHVSKSREDLSRIMSARYKRINGGSGFKHGTWYGFGTKKCQCLQCLKAKREWHDARNAKRRKGKPYGPRFIVPEQLSAD